VTEHKPGLGPALRLAWVGYQTRLDHAMSEAGFADRGFPDGRVLRLCRDIPDVSISRIGRELGITRQGAAKIVKSLHQRGYVSLAGSPHDTREKLVKLTPRANDYLLGQRNAARRIERQIQQQLGADAYQSLTELLAILATPEPPRLRRYLSDKTRIPPPDRH
jgi:DNA-binding MarR family transcriptional regulator